MTSRQPGQEPSGGLSSAGWAVRVIPSALLLLLASAGLRGSIAKPRWSGPMHTARVGVGVALIVSVPLSDILYALLVESGRSALRTLDDARAAIIASYVAMERSLADRGTARGVADTPDELLARATSGNIVRGAAPARLTALFYEARFSSHPMDQAQRQAAVQALDELADALAPRPEPAAASR
jgi:hypothetical protein